MYNNLIQIINNNYSKYKYKSRDFFFYMENVNCIMYKNACNLLS